MHEDEVLTDEPLVRALLRQQQPQWADRPLVLVPSYGTDHDVSRVRTAAGPDVALRLPRMAYAQAQAEREARWLPRLGPHLPLAVPALVARGRPSTGSGGYPYDWSAWEWLPGTDAHERLEAPGDLVRAAERLAAFVVALRAARTDEAPPRRPGQRGGPLQDHDEDVRSSLARLGDRADGPAVARVWDAALEADPDDGPATWFHGDLMPGNVLVRDHEVVAVIDWGGFGVGDPAADLLPAWHILDAEARPAFQEASGLDAAAWQRGRGWVVVQAVIALPYYWETNPGMIRQASRALAEVVADDARTRASGGATR